MTTVFMDLANEIENREAKRKPINWRLVFFYLMVGIPLALGWVVGKVVVLLRYVGSAFVVGYKEATKTKGPS